MKNEDIEIIISLLEEHDKKRTAQYENVKTNMDKNFELLNFQMKNIRKDLGNNQIRIQENSKEIKKIKSETSFIRYVSEHSKMSIFIIFIFLTGLLTLFSSIDKGQVKGLIKSIISFL